MALADDIRTLLARTNAELDAAHDYFTFSCLAWLEIQKDVKSGKTFTFDNPDTGTRVDEQQLIALSADYRQKNLASATFQQFVSVFEDFVFGLLRLWLAAHPRSLSKKQVEVGAIIDAPDKEAVLLSVVDRELNELKYERVGDWFAYLGRLVKIDAPTPDEIEALAEIKSTRDILVHNKGVVNRTYLAKSGERARAADGEALDLPERYHRASWAAIRKASGDVAEAAAARA